MFYLKKAAIGVMLAVLAFILWMMGYRNPLLFLMSTTGGFVMTWYGLKFLEHRRKW